MAADARTGAVADEFLRTLYLREVLRRDRTEHFEEALSATTFRPRNLKVAFFPGQHLPADGSHSPNGLRHRIGRRFRDFWYPRGGRFEVPYAPLLLYDIAGEAVEDRNVEVGRHDEAMDVLAVLLPADALVPGPGAADALAIARDRLYHALAVKARRRSVRCALIVTKCDQWPSPRPEKPRRDDLVNALRRRGSTATVAALIEAIESKSRSRAIDELFFTSRERSDLGVVVRGLQEFVAWCRKS